MTRGIEADSTNYDKIRNYLDYKTRKGGRALQLASGEKPSKVKRKLFEEDDFQLIERYYWGFKEINVK